MTLRPDVLHGHGAKGGLYVRAMGFLPCPHRALRVYTPHGGSLHRQCGGALFIAAEKALAANTDLLLFESEFIARRYKESVGATGALRRVARNGLREEEFAPVAVAPDAADFLTIGELSRIKGVDTLLEALALLRADGLDGPRLAVVGSGPEADRLAVLADRLGVSGAVAFHGAMPAREAFALGRILVLPSRAESLPYIVLEALAAQKPLVATNVGGVPEILGPFRDRLVPPGDPAALARALAEALRREPVSGAEREALARHIAAHFALGAMVDAGLAAYKQGLSMLDVRSRHLLEAL
jgi:glycosyltransferase involved in cell wall biosynthesis